MQRLNIQETHDDEQVAATADQLTGGGLVILPTETVYGLAADPSKPAAVAALREVKGRDSEQPFTLHLAKPADLTRFASPPGRLLRFLERVWPGPLTIILPGLDGQSIGLRVPSHAFTQAVIDRCGNGLLMTSVNPRGEPPMRGADEILAAFGEDQRIQLIADGGESATGEASAVVRLEGRRLEVLREGILDTRDVLVGAAAKVLFVCTGNTCRSPLAEGLARQTVANHLGVAADAVLSSGLVFVSAGTGTMPGMPASGGSLQAAAEVGVDLSTHRSNRLRVDLIQACDRIYCLSESHLGEVLHLCPEAKDKASLLHPKNKSVADPIGGSIEIYRETRDEIQTHLKSRLREIVAL